MEGLIVILDLTFSLIFSFLSKFTSQWRWPPLTSCAGMLKNKLRHRTLHPLLLFFFFRFTLPALWLNAGEIWVAWQSRCVFPEEECGWSTFQGKAV